MRDAEDPPPRRGSPPPKVGSPELEAWLNATNAKYREQELPPKQRPFQAMIDFTLEFNWSGMFDSPLARAVFDYFYRNSPPGAHQMGALFTGAFYYDACFWPVEIPITFGSVTLDAFEALGTMPIPVKQTLARDYEPYVAHWADCCDYAFGLDDVQKLQPLSPKAADFLRNAAAELDGAIAQLLAQPPNLKAILQLRMATEIFLKVLLIQEKGLDDAGLKKLSHSIEKIARECFELTGITVFQHVASKAAIFPEVGARYDGPELKASEVGKALLLAQRAASAVLRKYSGRDVKAGLIDGPANR